MLVFFLLSGCVSEQPDAIQTACLKANVLVTDLSKPVNQRHYVMKDGIYCGVYDAG